MNNNSLLRPGTLVQCKLDEEFLILWPSYKKISYENEAGRISNKDIMLIIDAKKSKKTEKNLSDEWLLGRYLVLASTGVSGWVGAGWVTEIN